MANARSLQELFEAAEYRVHLPRGGTACIRVGQPLPDALQDLLPDPRAPWGFITAWNPDAKPRPREINRKAQRALRDALLEHVARRNIHAGAGVGPGWREPSLFAAGIELATLDRLMRAFGQLAVVHGCGQGPAQLHWNA